MHKKEQLGGLLGRLLKTITKHWIALMKNVLKQLAKSVLIPVGLTAAALVTDAAIHKKIFGSVRFLWT